MTWQRIDEDTYIDDTLVTCAEYQLFIDEMREQGKYYQPDHWTSYQFPAGQAREPILGIRYSDALAFCEWLTGREDKKWNFRLPTQKETYTAPIKPYDKKQIGYWVDGKYQFEWIGNIPKDARNLNHARIRKYYHDLKNYLSLPLDLNQFLDYSISYLRFGSHSESKILAYAHDLDIARDRSLAHDRANIIAKTHSKARYYHTRVNLFTLQERIAGRSPAFEGIRLVKERIR